MTIQGSRRAAIALAAGVAAIPVVIAISALLLKQPGLLLLVVVLAPLQFLFVVRQLRLTSLTFDGADVIYRVGKRETRAARNDIANCALIGQQWVFTNSSGAQLLSVNAFGFSQTDVAAFCTNAGLNLTTPPLRPIDQSRKAVSSANVSRAVAVGLTLFMLLGAAGTIWLSLTAQDALSRYRSAPECGERVQGTTSSCRLQTQARVTRTELYGSHKASTDVHLTLIGGGGDYIANVANSNAPKTGDIVAVEVWSGRVTRLGSVDTSSNPEVNPNVNDVGALIVIGLIASITFCVAVWFHLQLRSARAAVRAAAAADSGSAEPVKAVHPDAPIDARGLPPCGINHHPKAVFFAHWDPKAMRTGVVVVSVIAAVVLAVLVLLAVYVSVPIFGGIAALGVAWFAVQLLGARSDMRVGGVFADDLHVGKITSSNFTARPVRRVYDRSSVLQCNVDGKLLTVVGVDGSTLFWSGGISEKDIDRFVAFVGRREVVEEPPEQPDPFAVPPIPTPLGILPLSVRRAAGVMQTVGGLMLGLGVINLVRIPGLSTDIRMKLLGILVSMALYGGAMVWLGLRLARGRPNSRQAALIGGGIATVFLLVAGFFFYTDPNILALYAILDLGALTVYGLVFNWLRNPATA